MAKIEVGEVWGVGRTVAWRDDGRAYRTPIWQYGFEVRIQFGVVMEKKDGQQVRGVSCRRRRPYRPKQQIRAARSFGSMVRDVARNKRNRVMAYRPRC
jgi:hypothetical protein